MKKLLSVFVAIAILFSLIGNTFAASEEYKYTEEELEFYKEQKRIDAYQIEQIYKTLDKELERSKLDNSLLIKDEPVILQTASSALGTYGDILVSLVADSGSIGFAGHAAIVANNNWQTIESYAKKWSPINKNGVQRYPNNWRESGSILCRPIGASTGQYRTAASYAESQIGKPYNWIFTDKRNTNKFYCSQLVWLAWLDAGIDCEIGSIPNAIIAPADLVNSSNTRIIKHIR